MIAQKVLLRWCFLFGASTLPVIAYDDSAAVIKIDGLAQTDKTSFIINGTIEKAYPSDASINTIKAKASMGAGLAPMLPKGIRIVLYVNERNGEYLADSFAWYPIADEVVDVTSEDAFNASIDKGVFSFISAQLQGGIDKPIAFATVETDRIISTPQNAFFIDQACKWIEKRHLIGGTVTPQLAADIRNEVAAKHYSFLPLLYIISPDECINALVADAIAYDAIADPATIGAISNYIQDVLSQASLKDYRSGVSALLKLRSKQIKEAVLRALAKQMDPQFAVMVIPLLDSPDSRVAYQALATLEIYGLDNGVTIEQPSTALFDANRDQYVNECKDVISRNGAIFGLK